MASLVSNLWAPSSFALTEFKPQSRAQIRCSAAQESSILSTDTVRLNGVSSAKEQERTIPMMDRGNGHLPAGGGTREKKKKGEEEVMQEKLEPLWDDGYGTRSVKDYMDSAKDVIKPDGGPLRWFSPIECGPPLKNSPVLLFLPGMDGVGLGLMLHHKALGRVFEVWCLHIPVKDRTPFEEMVNFVEETVRNQHASSPNKPIYLVGDSFGGCLALAVAARNPVIDLVLVLANPATSFNRSQLQPLLPFLEAIPIEHHFTVPYLLSFVMGEPVKMAMVTVDATLPPRIAVEHLAGNLTALLPHLSVLADIIPKDTLLWKLKLLRSAASYANSRLHAVTAEVLVLASGKDNMLPSGDEAQRLERSLRNCKVKYFKDNGHAILLEDGVNLLTMIKGTFKYRQSRKHDVVMDFLPPSDSEFKQALESNKIYRYLIGSVMFSTLEDGKIVRGLSGVPSEGPVILVGYHMLLGLELVSLVEEFLRQRKILVRGIAHPTLFSQLVETDSKEFTFYDTLKIYGATPVSATNLFKLFKTKSHVLLYPGGAREALHRKGETYKLFWPDQPEFVRMAAKFGATIVPFGVIGEDDMAELVFDYNDLMKIPVLNDYIRKKNEDWKFRAHVTGEIANQELYMPGFLPKVPGRLYYLFGKPIQTKGRQELLKDREKARELYLQIKSEVENSMAYLLRKREEDPYRNILDRTAYRAFSAPIDQVPTFDP
ncbi:acyltransferase-like protein At1g54570, chloroplastic [Coffea eugenioides]|uniref:Phytyl ester synthase 1, chloroplastic n=2 Tax=Coffea TaxID=13442 RepID=A0A6P6WGT5_COFAR|nr:acyltransferase-like protein At1g54570, chloroplastic [Coffea arabica]XP_027159438.1 acyltransferase-like protein At1g54570, chloroplastic [Coffea eugenioides]